MAHLKTPFFYLMVTKSFKENVMDSILVGARSYKSLGDSPVMLQIEPSIEKMWLSMEPNVFMEKAIKEIKESNRGNLVRKGSDWLPLAITKAACYQVHNWCRGRRQAGSLGL